MNVLELNRSATDFFREHPGQAFDETGLQQIEFAVERWTEVLPELRGLFGAHWKEIALDQDSITLDIDFDLYATLDRNGELHLVTVRDDRDLVGYHLSVIRPHPHYKSTLHCLTDVFYLRPEYRKGMIGYKLMKFFRDSVRARGVKKILMGTKMTIDIDPIMRRLGFKAIERIYSLVL